MKHTKRFRIPIYAAATFAAASSISVQSASAHQFTRELVVWEYDLQPDATSRTMLTTVSIDSTAHLKVFESWQQEPPPSLQIPYASVTKVNTGQVVAASWYFGTGLQLSSYSISSAGYIGPQETAGTGEVESASLASMSPGSLLTAVINGGGNTEPIFWTVDPITGAFTRGQSTAIFVTSNSYIAAGTLDGTAITADGAFLRLDAWGPVSTTGKHALFVLPGNCLLKGHEGTLSRRGKRANFAVRRASRTRSSGLSARRKASRVRSSAIEKLRSRCS